MEAAAVARVAVALIFAAAAVQKARDLRDFSRTIEDHGLSSRPRVSLALASGVVVAEGTIAIALIFDPLVRVAVVAAVALLAAFSVVTARNLLRERPVDCGCLGSAVRLEMGWATVVVNAALATGLLWGLSQTPALALGAGEHASAAQAVVMIGCATLIAANYWLIAYARSVSRLVDEALTGTEIMELAR